MSAVSSLLTLAITIGESEVAAAPSIVVPDARRSSTRLSRMTVIVTAGLVRARASNAPLAFGIAGSGSGSTGMGVVGVVDVVVVDEVVVVVVALVVVLATIVEVGVESTIWSTGAVESELAADWPEHAVVRRSPTMRAIGCQRTPSR